MDGVGWLNDLVLNDYGTDLSVEYSFTARGVYDNCIATSPLAED